MRFIPIMLAGICSVSATGAHGGHVHSTFQWKSAATAPKVASLDGMDTFVETDCAASGCDTTGNEPHMLIYTSKCASVGPTTDPWFDVTTGACRGGGNP